MAPEIFFRIMAKKKQMEQEPEEPVTENTTGELRLEDIHYQEPGEEKSHRLSPLRRQQLVTIGVEDVMELAVANVEDIINVCGIARDVASSYVSAARAALEEHGLIRKTVTTGVEELERRKKLLYLTTGSAKFDELLKGGIEQGSVTEIYGAFGSGKTQICHTLAVNAQLPVEKKGLGGNVCWIDAEHTFRPERLREIAGGIEGMDPDHVLENVSVARVRSSAQLELFVHGELAHVIKEKNIKLIIVDSIINLHRNEFAGRGTLYDRQHRLAGIVFKLIKVADVYGVAVLFTNQVSANPDGNMFGNPEKATGGNSIAHLSAYRLAIHKASGNERVIKIIDSPHHAFSDVRIQITREGVKDVD